MPVPTSLDDLDPIPSNNSPDGAEAVFPLLNDHIQAAYAFIAQVRDRAGAGVSSADLASTAAGKGAALVGFKQAGTGAASRTALDKLREHVSAEDFFLAGESDATAMIQRALDSGAAVIELQGVEYRTSAPIYMDGRQALVGRGRNKTTILKTTNTAGTGSNTARGGTVTDSYAKNAIIICRHGDNAYNYGTTIKGLTLKSDGYLVEYGIFAPRMSQWHMEDVYVYQCRYGVVAHDAWLTQFTKVVCDAATQRGLNGNNYGWASGTKGFWWADDGSGAAAGTSLSASNCWARDCHTGWDLYGLKYSALNGCASDNISECAYRFNLCDIALNGCGHENVQIGTTYSAAVACEYSKLTLNGCSSFSVFGATSGTTAWLKADSSSVSIDGSTFANFTTPGTSYNLIVQNGSKLTLDGTTIPTNGNTFVSYSGGSQVINLSATPPSIATSDGLRYLRGRARDNQLLEKTGKAVLAAGSPICTLTCNGGASAEYAAVRLKISWFDTAFPSAVGLSNVEVVCYQDAGSNYRQAINTSVNIGAGNGYTTAPTYTITRAGNVWSVVMTPAHGDLTCYTITAEVEAMTGFTVALP